MDTPDPRTDAASLDPEQFVDDSPRPGPRRSRQGFLLAILVITLAYAAVWAVAETVGLGNELRLFLASGLEYAPFVPLCVLAYAGQANPAVRPLAAGYWFLLVCGMALAVFVLTAETFINPEALSHGKGLLLSGLHSVVASLFVLPMTLFGIGFGVLVGLLGYTPAVRRLAARVLPLDPESFVHATALATVLGLTIIAFVPLIILGQPPLLLLTGLPAELKQGQGEAQVDAEELRATVYGFVWLVPCTVIGVGYPMRRTFANTLQRLGLARPTTRHLIVAAIAIPLLVLGVSGLGAAVDEIWTHYGWPRTDETKFNELMRFALSRAGAVIIGVTAGIGEELVVRGMLQPRLGILLSNVFFASLHALQYNWDSLAIVFLVGLTLGVVRKYTNTTTSAIVHGGYDFTLVLIDALQSAGGGS
jgi:membrane protease YdiL (CAAX protease family)